MTSIAYRVVRSNRKSLALVVDCEANVIIRAPFRVSDNVIASFIKSKERWVIEKQTLALAFGQTHRPIVIAPGETMLYLGGTYTMAPGDCPAIYIGTTTLHIPQQAGTGELVGWMKLEALRVMTERTAYFSDLMGASHGAVKVTNAKTRWGSCSAKNSLNFTWRLIMCPMPVIDYIVVHELCHIAHKNHGQAFWAAVKTVLPNYKQQQDWLRRNRKLMDMI